MTAFDDVARTYYQATAETLRDRILALIPEHPEILTLESPFDLFGIDGFHCADLQPSLAQAGAALASAREQWAATSR